MESGLVSRSVGFRFPLPIQSVVALIVTLVFCESAAASPWGFAVVSYDPGLGAAPGYQNPATALGAPERFTGEGVFPGAVTMFNSAFGTDEIVSIGEGGHLTVRFDQPVLDGPGNLYIVESQTNRVRRIDAASGTITTVAGTGVSGFGGDGGPAANAQLYQPTTAAVDSQGNLYIADTRNHRIRRVDGATGDITTIAGTTRGYGGDGGPATASQLDYPIGVAVDNDGTVYGAEVGPRMLRKHIAR